MMQTKYFMGWLMSYLFMWGGAYYLFELGLFDYLWKVDISKLSFLILGIFTLFYTRLGYFILKFDILDREVKSEDLDPGFESAGVVMSLGLLGTIIGFIAMTSSFSGVDVSNLENFKQLFSIATTGMSTALYTTAVGLVANITLRFTHYLTERLL